MSYAIFDGSYTAVTATGAYLHDYGQELKIVGLDLPSAVEAHFSLERSGQSVLSMGICENKVATIPIPDKMLEEAGSFFCYIFRRSEESGKTQYEIKIPVTRRPGLPTETTDPTEGQIAYFNSVIAEMQAILDQAVAMKNVIVNGLTIGEVETLEAGSEASASITDDDGTLALNLGIPKGDKGDGSDAFCVNITRSGNTPVADKTYEQIKEALRQGKRVYAFAPEPSLMLGNQNTILELLWEKGKVYRTSAGKDEDCIFFGLNHMSSKKWFPLSLNDLVIKTFGYAIYSDNSVECFKEMPVIENIFQQKLTFDAAPTEDSENPVTSGGVHTALEGKAGLFKVTITSTYDENTHEYEYACDKTHAEILSAANAGNYVYAYFDRLQSIMPMVMCGTQIWFGYSNIASVVAGKTMGCLYVVIASDNTIFTSFENVVVAEKSDLDVLEQRVAALERALNT